MPTDNGDINSLFNIFFPFTQKEISDGIMYLGYAIKPNNYDIKDWSWIVAKVERKMNLWCNHWISRGG